MLLKTGRQLICTNGYSWGTKEVKIGDKGEVIEMGVSYCLIETNGLNHTTRIFNA